MVHPSVERGQDHVQHRPHGEHDADEQDEREQDLGPAGHGLAPVKLGMEPHVLKCGASSRAADLHGRAVARLGADMCDRTRIRTRDPIPAGGRVFCRYGEALLHRPRIARCRARVESSRHDKNLER